MAVVGFRSKNAAYKLVERFVQRGWLEKDEKGRLLPGRLFQDLPVLGTVAAGFPSPADEELTDTMSLDDYLISNKEASALHPQHDTKEQERELSSPGVLESSCTHRLIPASNGSKTSKEEGECSMPGKGV
jgi:hypothetical protein